MAQCATGTVVLALLGRRTCLLVERRPPCAQDGHHLMCGGSIDDTHELVNVIPVWPWLAAVKPAALFCTTVDSPVGKTSSCGSHSYGLNGIGMRRGAQHKV